MNEREFGKHVKLHLDSALDLGPTTLQQLRTARAAALKCQRVSAPAFAWAWVDSVAIRLGGNPASMAVVAAGAALIIALVVAQQYWSRTPSVEEIEEIDSALLTSDLPINAYLDKSFDSWLKRSQH